MLELTAFYQTVEFYIAAAVIAAAIIALCVRPAGHAVVITHLFAGETSPDTSTGVGAVVELRCNDDGSVDLTRHGVEGIGADGAVSIAVSVNGFDITIDERLTPGTLGQGGVMQARFGFDFMGAERYHVRYNSDSTGSFAVFTLNNRPGIVIVRPLRM